MIAGINLTLAAGGAHVWVATQPKPWKVAQLESLLSRGEQARQLRLRDALARRGFIFRRGLLRMILGYYLEADPAELRLEAHCLRCGGQHGKLRLRDESGRRNIRFSLSQSNSRAVYAFSHSYDIGVDVERVQPGYPWRELAATALTPGERAVAVRLGDELACRWFFRQWTRKEAVAKLVGLGVGLPFDQLDPARHGLPGSTVTDLSLGHGYVGALAVDAQARITTISMRETRGGWSADIGARACDSASVLLANHSRGE